MTPPKESPDAVFTNDWLSTHIIKDQPYIFTYPMYSESRKPEVQPQKLIKTLEKELGVKYKVKDFRDNSSKALEGNAALVFDNSTKTAFLSKSLRGDESIAQKEFSFSAFTNALGNSGVNEHNDIGFPNYRKDPGNKLTISIRKFSNNPSDYNLNIFMI